MKMYWLIAAGILSAPHALAERLRDGLIDPDEQPIFRQKVPNALDPGFQFDTSKSTTISIGVNKHHVTGLVDSSGEELYTPIWGYGTDGKYSWPSKTIHAETGVPVRITWANKLPLGPGHLLTSVDGKSVVDTTVHWAFCIPGYQDYTLEDDGIPIVTHLHGGHTGSASDGNPEFFYTKNFEITGPQFVKKQHYYANDQPAGALWFHDHALGIMRLNVYAGMSGFYMLRDHADTGHADNMFDLPVFPYEAALAIQDRMFKENGELFYPAFPGDPFFEDFIDGEGAELDEEFFGKDGGPTALAEFFGDHIVVNGKIWPTMKVEQRKYRLRLLNGCDSRFLVVEFHVIPGGVDEHADDTGWWTSEILDFSVIGNDQGWGKSIHTNRVVMEPGSRIDAIVDFADVPMGSRIILKNFGGDEPFGGDIPGTQEFSRTDRIMAFDVTEDFDASIGDHDIDYEAFDKYVSNSRDDYDSVDRVRRVGLFEGTDEFGRLQPILGTAEPATDYKGDPIYWPDVPPYNDPDVDLAGKQMEGTAAWHAPTTENPALNDIEEWEIWNVSADAHPIHLHLVAYEVISRHDIELDPSLTGDDGDDDDDDDYAAAAAIADDDASISWSKGVISKSKKSDRSKVASKSKKNGKSDKSSTSKKSGRNDKSSKSKKSGSSDKSSQSKKSGSSDKSSQSKKSGRSDKSNSRKMSGRSDKSSQSKKSSKVSKSKGGDSKKSSRKKPSKKDKGSKSKNSSKKKKASKKGKGKGGVSKKSSSCESKKASKKKNKVSKAKRKASKSEKSSKTKKPSKSKKSRKSKSSKKGDDKNKKGKGRTKRKPKKSNKNKTKGKGNRGKGRRKKTKGGNKRKKGHIKGGNRRRVRRLRAHQHDPYEHNVGDEDDYEEEDTDEDDDDGDEEEVECMGVGVCLEEQPLVQHNGLVGTGYKIVYPDGDPGNWYGPAVDPNEDPDNPVYADNGRKDVVVALPGQVTKIRVKFTKPGRYVWYCHLLSHEDHEMMRVMHVGPGAHDGEIHMPEMHSFKVQDR